LKLCEQTGRDATGLDDQVFSSSDYDDYDPVNNLKSISRHEDGDKGECFVYDDANQLQSVTYNSFQGSEPPFYTANWYVYGADDVKPARK